MVSKAAKAASFWIWQMRSQKKSFGENRPLLENHYRLASKRSRIKDRGRDQKSSLPNADVKNLVLSLYILSTRREESTGLDRRKKAKEPRIVEGYRLPSDAVIDIKKPMRTFRVAPV